MALRTTQVAAAAIRRRGRGGQGGRQVEVGWNVLDGEDSSEHKEGCGVLRCGTN